MLFEFINAFAIYQQIINNALREYLNKFVTIYLNNIFIYLFILKKHIKHVNKILKYLNKQNLRIKSKKCVFYREKIDFLKYIVERNETRINSIKFQTIKN